MKWFAAKHALLAHLPVAVGLLLPLALLASLRPGRGIRPWWTAARYLGWAGLVGLGVSLVSGWSLGRAQGFLTPGRWLPPHGDPALPRHLLYATASLPVAIAALAAMHRRRKEHQGLGVLPLFLGLGWSALALLTGWTGQLLAHPAGAVLPRLVPPAVPAPPPAAPAKSAPEPAPGVPVRVLDYAALEPIQAWPVKSMAHGGRWIRVWVTPSAAAAYRAGAPLPDGTLAVMSTVEDRWGRPGPDPGPLYALEMKGGAPQFTFYWGRVPAASQAAMGGETRIFWRSPDPHLAGCATCHAQGPAPADQRSSWTPFRKPAPSPAAPAPSAPTH